MATSVYGFVQFSDGSFASLADNSVSEVTASEIVTGGTGLNQVAGVSIGTAFEGKVAIAASLLVQTDTAVTGFFWARWKNSINRSRAWYKGNRELPTSQACANADGS